MNATIQEIASVLRSTEPMAAQFVQRVQERFDQPVAPEEILAVMTKISPKRLSFESVVSKVQDAQKRKQQRAAQRTKRQSAKSPSTATPPPAPVKPKTLAERLEAVLKENWDQAEAEGLTTNRMPAQDFIKAVYRYAGRREASRQRILQAARQLNEKQVLLTPALVADAVHELFLS